jgi:hypothetical protein
MIVEKEKEEEEREEDKRGSKRQENCGPLRTVFDG